MGFFATNMKVVFWGGYVCHPFRFMLICGSFLPFLGGSDITLLDCLTVRIIWYSKKPPLFLLGCVLTRSNLLGSCCVRWTMGGHTVIDTNATQGSLAPNLFGFNLARYAPNTRMAIIVSHHRIYCVICALLRF